MRGRIAGFVLVALLAACGPEPAPVPVATPVEPAAPLADRVAAAVRHATEQGTHWHRTDALVGIGAEAVPLLRAQVLDESADTATRALVAQALGRIGGADAKAALRAVLAEVTSPDELRRAAEAGLFLAGEPGPVDARIAALRARHPGIAIARAGAEQQVAQILYATGRFREGADAWKAIVRAESDPDRIGLFAYDWACCAALSGAVDEAMEAVALAVKSKRTDLAWMQKDGDLATIRGRPRFDNLIAEGHSARSDPSVTPSLRGEPDFEEYEQLRKGYWEGAFESWVTAQNSYWVGYEAWLAAGKRTRSDESAAEYKRLNGPVPEDPTPEWTLKFRALLARHREDALGAKIRGNLFTMFTNKQMQAEWSALYRESMETPGQESVVGSEARAAPWMGGLGTAGSDLGDRLRAWLVAHPEGVPAAQVRMALADAAQIGDAAAARAGYEEIVRLHPGTSQAEEAAGAIYEMDHLAIGMRAPEFDAKDLLGAPVSLAALRGRVVVLDFWATWCGPCVGELPNVIALEKRFRGPDFALVGISLDGDGLALADFLEERAMPWPQVCDLRAFDGALTKLYHVRGIPDTVLVGRDGRILARGLRGDDLEDAVAKALAAPR